ncbi:hypothetical protein FT643_11090 [Ketobacter sp. MCCC 1A13808]|uniref:CsiV family protein n=1 Tax=Ketobacter sp. MCCC 1A13808 TaxID=2602738 RepID=UPI0012EBA39B|nr:CsiV family protein [Ketobacter sp. MCCC 1A13808]MVF12686.1 hypothetical protein [Ketobacter sp. MCCC 1A13808]
MKLTLSKINTLTLSLLLALPSGIATTAYADQDKANWYQVSLVVFKNKNSPLGNEKWRPPAELELAYPEGAIDLEDAANISGKRTAFRTTEPTDTEFKEVLSSLKLSSNYEVMTSKSWLQPGLDTKNAVPVLINAGKEYEGLYELSGSVTLVVSRYLHIKTDLWLSEYTQRVEVVAPWWQDENGNDNSQANETAFNPYGTAQSTDTENAPAQPYTNTDFVVEPSPVANDRYEAIQTVELKQSRRMRSGELHYLDNPLFGVVVKVIPHKAK